jgi:regulator of nucleoside diphosphate kinase
MMTSVQSDATRPQGPIYMTVSDMERLMALVKGYRLQGREDGSLDVLEEELDRALVMDAGRRFPSDVVTLDSRVLVWDLDSGKERLFTLVLPSKANVDEGRISVLAPLGMAVLGYRTGDEIEWDVPGGRRRFMIRRVIHQPEASARRQAARARPAEGAA